MNSEKFSGNSQKRLPRSASPAMTDVRKGIFCSVQEKTARAKASDSPAGAPQFLGRAKSRIGSGRA
jgi:hypothetical protein